MSIVTRTEDQISRDQIELFKRSPFFTSECCSTRLSIDPRVRYSEEPPPLTDPITDPTPKEKCQMAIEESKDRNVCGEVGKKKLLDVLLNLLDEKNTGPFLMEVISNASYLKDPKDRVSVLQKAAEHFHCYSLCYGIHRSEIFSIIKKIAQMCAGCQNELSHEDKILIQNNIYSAAFYHHGPVKIDNSKFPQFNNPVAYYGIKTCAKEAVCLFSNTLKASLDNHPLDRNSDSRNLGAEQSRKS